MKVQAESRARLVDINDIVKGDGMLVSLLKKPASRFLGVDCINSGYAAMRGGLSSEELEEKFFRRAVESFQLRYEIDDEKLAAIPKAGPVIVVANHPHGLADGIILGDILTQLRPDMRLVANEQLNLCPEIRPWLISVDAFESGASTRKNLGAVREMLGYLRKGGLIGMFPAGSASSFSMKDRCVVDDSWNENIAAIVRKTGATVVPLHFEGRNSLLFQGVSMLNRDARVALLPRELARSMKRTVKISVGTPIKAEQLTKFSSDRTRIDYLRMVTYCQGRKKKKKTSLEKPSSRKMAEVIAARPTENLIAEVEALPVEAKLLSSGDFDVMFATAEQIPELLVEIGRLRELTFREVGEGSGLACDLDEFDQHYVQLFLWDREKKRIAGGYRIGLTDQILANHGIKGLYNRKFFRFKSEVFETIRNGLEMGRSFITKEYQRRPLSLGLIWQGIGQFVVRHPQYRYLYGVVSTSADYTPFSFKLIVDFLEHFCMDNELAQFIKAKNPPKGRALKRSEIASLVQEQLNEQDLSALVTQVEDDGKGIPVLLRQYLKLNGKILGFNIDKEFGGVLDCMIMVDIHESPERSIRKYLGKEAAAAIQEMKNPSNQEG